MCTKIFQPIDRNISVTYTYSIQFFRANIIIYELGWGGYVKVKIDLSSSGFEPTTSDTRIPRSTHYSRLLQRMFEKKLKISQTKPKKKIPVYVLNYFSGQKGVQEKYLHMVVKIKPVY